MIVAVHYANLYSPPVGVWWWPQGASSPDSYYVDGSDAAQIRGNFSMLSVESDVQFAYWAQRLADGSPWIQGWVVRYANEGETPRDVLDEMRRAA